MDGNRRANLASASSSDKPSFLPAAGGKKSAHTCADEAEYRRRDGLSLVAGAGVGLRRAVIIATANFLGLARPIMSDRRRTNYCLLLPLLKNNIG